MQTLWLVTVSVVVAALIGGLTNYIAIKMLFYPREEIKIGTWRLPFTPGIIPKRRDEIAVSLGRIVSEHLVTQDSIRKVIQQSKTREQLESYFFQVLERWESSELSLGEWLYANFASNDESYEQWQERLQHIVQEFIQSGMIRLWDQISSKRLKELVPQEVLDKQDAYAGAISERILREAEHYLVSPEGQVWLDGMLQNVLQRTSGLKGFVAGFFIGDPRTVHQISAWLVNGLHAPELRMKLQEIISQRFTAWSELTVEEGVPRSETIFHELSSGLANQLINGTTFGSVLEVKLGRLVSYFDQPLRSGIPKWSHQTLQLAEAQLPLVLDRLNLPNLVRQQVSAFPIIQVERIVLEVSGREFRAITWLGALLGGMIGLVQSTVYLYIL